MRSLPLLSTLLLLPVACGPNSGAIHTSGPQSTDNNRLATAATMPNPTDAMGCAAVAGGQIYCAGGNWGCNGDCGQSFDQLFDPGINQWNSPAAPPALPIGAEFSPLVTGGDGRLYLINAGSGLGIDHALGPTPTNLTYALTPGATQWTPVASDVIWRAAACGAEGADGRIYVFGGFDSGGVGMSRPSVYDPVANTWTVLYNAPMPTARGLCAATRAPDGRILVLGGVNCDPGVGAPCGGETSVAAVEAFDPVSQTWSLLPPMGQLRDRLGAATGADGRIYAVGGEAWSLTQRSPARSAEAFDPILGTWTPIANLNAARVGLQLVSDVDGRLYAIGGYSAGTVEVYTPGTDVWVP
jgi:hypothetical protein